MTEDAKRVAARLRLTNAETRALDSMGHRWWRLYGMDEPTAKRRLYRLGAEAYRNRLMLAWARAGGADDTNWREMATLPQRWSAPKFPLRAADFIARGIAEGPALGHVLALAEDAWLADGFPLEAAVLAGTLGILDRNASIGFAQVVERVRKAKSVRFVLKQKLGAQPEHHAARLTRL